MLNDIVFQVKEVPDQLVNMNKDGIKSVCNYLKLPVKGLEFLEKHQLIKVVFNHITNSMEEDAITIRMQDDIPIGVPSKNATLKNLKKQEEFLMDEFEIDLNEIMFPKKTFKKIFDKEFEFVPNDLYKMGMNFNMDILNNNVKNELSLLRLWCTNGSVVKESTMIKPNFHITKFREMLNKYENDNSFMETLQEKIKNILKKLHNRNTNVNDLLLLRKIEEGLNLQNDKLTKHINEGIDEVVELYESPSDVYKISDVTLNSFPIEWKESAVLPNTSAYDTWNVATDAISRFEEEIVEENINNMEQTKQNILTFNVELGKMLVYKEKHYAKLK